MTLAKLGSTANGVVTNLSKSTGDVYNAAVSQVKDIPNSARNLFTQVETTQVLQKTLSDEDKRNIELSLAVNKLAVNRVTNDSIVDPANASEEIKKWIKTKTGLTYIDETQAPNGIPGYYFENGCLIKGCVRNGGTRRKQRQRQRRTRK